MNAAAWERMVARWDRWYESALADLRAKAGAGDAHATRVLERYDVLNRGGMSGRPALNRALRERAEIERRAREVKERWSNVRSAEPRPASAERCGHVHEAGGLRYTCERPAGHSGNHQSLDYRWMNEAVSR